MHTNLVEINTEQAEHLTQFTVRSGSNIFLFGQPGLGKTAISTQSILNTGYKCSYINLSMVERPDLMGFPDLNSKSDLVEYKSPHFLPPLKEGAKPSSVLLVDEVDKAPQENTAPLLELMQSRTINGKKIDVAAIILTGNTIEDRSGSNELYKALLDRGAKYLLKFDLDKWLEWAKQNDVHDLIQGFIKHNPNLCCKTPDRATLAFPTPRSWTLASRAIYKARELKLTDIETVSMIVGGFVGNEAGTKFRVWFEHFKKFEPMALSLVEKGLHPADYNQWSITEQIVFVISACHMARLKFVAASKTKPKYACIDRLCEFLSGVEPELQTLGISGSFPLDLVVDPRYRLYQNESFFNLSQKLSGAGAAGA